MLFSLPLPFLARLPDDIISIHRLLSLMVSSLNDLISSSKMAEKRKLPPRAGREHAAKKRVSEATPNSSQKKKAATPRAPSPPPEPVQEFLPIKVQADEGLPVVRVRQPANLSDKEYQSIAERFDS